MISYRMTKLGGTFDSFCYTPPVFAYYDYRYTTSDGTKFFTEFLRYKDCLIMSWMTVQKTIHQRSPQMETICVTLERK